MEKKRSVGITALGFLAIIGGIIAFLLNFLSIVRYTHMPYWKEKSFIIYAYSLLIFCNIANIFQIIYGVGILKLKEWARRMAIITSIAVLIFYSLLIVTFHVPFTYGNIIGMTISVGFPLVIIYFFTRPKVKEQFK